MAAGRRQTHGALRQGSAAGSVGNGTAYVHRGILSVFCRGVRSSGDVPEILDWLDQQDIPYGVATATYGELAEAALRRLHVWERLRFLLTEQDAGTPKTQPKIFQLAAQKLHLGRRQIAVVEDSLHALEGAKNGGFFTIGIADPENAPVWKEICATATVHIHDILEMKQFF